MLKLSVSWCQCFIILIGAALGALAQAANAAQQPSAAGTAPAPALREQQVKTFTWFGTLGFPDAKGRPLVRVATGHWSQAGNGPPKNSYDHGILLEEKGDDFRVCTFDLKTTTYHKTPQNTPEHERVGYEPLELSRWTADYLKWLQEAADKKDDFMRHATRTFARRQLSERAEIFVIAWMCWRNGLDKEAGQLYDHAMALPGETRGRQEGLLGMALPPSIASDIAHAQMWQAILDFDDLSISRAQLLERFGRFVRNYPQSEHIRRAQETAALLKQMIREDEEHAKARKAGKPFEQLARADQIKELIFLLRDQNGKQWGQPGSCDVFAVDEDHARGHGKGDTPAHRLANMGYEAVPQLIEALDDERFTRSIGFHRDFYFSHHVLRVGDCAEQIIARIAGRYFGDRGPASDRKANVKADIQTWYNDLQKKGEKRLLIEATEKGDSSSARQGEKLLERYPDVALPSIIAGAKAAKEGWWIRPPLVQLAAKIKGDGPVPFLLSEVKDGPLLSSRLAAAKGLQEHGRPEGIIAMITEWNKHKPGDERDREDSPWVRDELATFLATSAKPDALAALGKDLLNRSSDVRRTIIFDVVYNLRPEPKELKAAIENLLVPQLDDADERFQMAGLWRGKTFSNPRLCDIVADALNQLDPQNFPFDPSASLTQRNRNILLMKNVWRREHGLAALPIPSPRVIPAVADDKLFPLVEKFVKSRGDEQAKWQAEIEELGLGALPGVNRYLAKMSNTEEPRFVALQGLAQRLAWIVAEVIVSEDSIKPDKELVRRLDAIKGKPLQPRLFLEELRSWAKNLPKGANALLISADRAHDGTGFIVKVTLRNDPAPVLIQRVAVGERPLHNMSGGGKWLGFDPKLLQNALSEAMRAPVDQPIEIRVQEIAD